MNIIIHVDYFVNTKMFSLWTFLLTLHFVGVILKEKERR
nr:MAG TPA: hypothetical protein [Caudoviricetes sp.]